MGERPSMQAVQRPLIIGILAGIILGCALGSAFGLYYAWQVDPALYVGGTIPTELAPGYQSHYIDTVVDSYNVNRQVELAQTRLQAFDQATIIRELGARSANFVANGQGVEAQAVNELAANLNQADGWNPETVGTVVGALAGEYQGDGPRSQAVLAYAEGLGSVPPPTSEGAAEGEAPAEPAPAAEPAAPPAEPVDEGGWSLWTLCLTGLGILLAIVAIVLLIGRIYQARKASQPVQSQVVWEEEGTPPIKQWSGTYELGQDNYDEFFTIETLDGDFLGESGMGIMKAISGTSPKQVVAFDVGLFDKTDITTLSKVVVSEKAYQNDEDLQTKVDVNPQAEAIFAEPGKTFTLETSALRIDAKVEDIEYDETETYFKKLELRMDVFLNEGVDLRIGTMDVPDEYQ
ncbi:MAG: hypothetical protein AAF485_24870 [Chloroflexota bacterium]